MQVSACTQQFERARARTRGMEAAARRYYVGVLLLDLSGDRFESELENEL